MNKGLVIALGLGGLGLAAYASKASASPLSGTGPYWLWIPSMPELPRMAHTAQQAIEAANTAFAQKDVDDVAIQDSTGQVVKRLTKKK